MGQIGRELGFAMEIARGAGAIIRTDFKKGVEGRLKRDGTPISDTDKMINDMVITNIRGAFPTHDVMAEEGSYLGNKSDYRWFCDPIDGTIAFLHGCPTSVFELGLVVKRRARIGVVYDPFRDRMYYAELGKGAFLNGDKIQVSADKKLDGSVIGLSYWRNAQFNMPLLYQKLVSRDVGANVLMLGSIAYMGALVSCGELSANIHPARAPYDSAGLKVIIEEAGGRVTDIFGDEQRYSRRIKGCMMSNGILHPELVKLTKLIRSG